MRESVWMKKIAIYGKGGIGKSIIISNVSATMGLTVTRCQRDRSFATVNLLIISLLFVSMNLSL
ncbi:hypothetical protein [Sporomusa termitida]|uniref:hypothetical protein n=1 Tax=Sporomusa termitida TaxID=2377 RepID=UPI003CCC739C